MNIDDQTLLEFLGLLERREASLTTWGLVDGFFTFEELKDRISRFLDERSLLDRVADTDEIIDELEKRCLLFNCGNDGEDAYRTRVGETLRLMSKLRQLFPYHMAGRKWLTASTLVADYRFLLRPREFPKRRLTPSEVVEEFEGISLNQMQKDVLKTLLGAGGESPIKLAVFQKDSARCILTDLEKKRSRGTIICAGTGSGKTLAFYIPALIHLSRILDSSFWTKCIAIYPRNELLKDQFSETFMQARKIDCVLLAAGKRKLKIGAVFGYTPQNISTVNTGKAGWERKGSGYVFPIMKCTKCGMDLIWTDVDMRNGVERLTCVSPRCGVQVCDDEIVLTRKQMLNSPPDILFTTTEMLNQRISDSSYSNLLGIKPTNGRTPEIVLLDEVHTYSDVHGAQVAMLLRRWRYATGTNAHFVGLSATLRDARRFFADLVGLRTDEVNKEIEPSRDEIDKEGMEYMLALRGDPVSGASLLSTSIQSVMLAGRVMDSLNTAVSKGAFGKKVFVFTDDLDVTNRLYFDMLDAEGRDSRGAPLRNRQSLAFLRTKSRADHDYRFINGQSWDICEEIGHSNNKEYRLKVGRTSSQDVGMQSDVQIVVATASLEVGFNDPDVGAIVQHKAPRGVAQFLQRKGRAGRTRTMRPWTILVLSDYGRDRLAYLGYDLLFDPELPPVALSIKNRYVLKMQAAYAFMDWMALMMKAQPNGSIWRDFSRPASNEEIPFRSISAERQKKELEIIDDVLNHPEMRTKMEQYIKTALQIDDIAMDSLMWEAPRALMTAVLPTIRRRLDSGWKRVQPHSDVNAQDYQVRNNPLPDFVPSTLFSDLNLPEITINLADNSSGSEDDNTKTMPVLQALREFSPGRVSKRFGVAHRGVRHWVPPSSLSDTPLQFLSLNRYVADYEDLGIFNYFEGHVTKSVRCIRPYALQPVIPDGHVLDTSNSSLDWRSQILINSSGRGLFIPKLSRWNDLLKSMVFFTHNLHDAVEVRRFAIGANANIRFDGGGELETYIRFVEESENQEKCEELSVGFILDVDAMVLRINLPTDLVISAIDNDNKSRALRTYRFRHLVETSPDLDGIANTFKRGWICQIFLSLVSIRAISSCISLQEAWGEIKEGNCHDQLDEIMDVIFQGVPPNEMASIEDAFQEECDEEQGRKRLHAKMIEIISNKAVIIAVDKCINALWETPNENWLPWIKSVFKATLGSAFLSAIEKLCPNLNTGDLVIDIADNLCMKNDTNESDWSDEIWITETTIGGAGIIEEILAIYGENPRRLFELVETALQPTDYEIMDEELGRILALATSDSENTINSVFQLFRAAESHEQLTKAFDKLVRALSDAGICVSHSVIATLNARILRPGSTDKTDRYICDLIKDWKSYEQCLGIEVDARIFAYLSSLDDRLERSLGEEFHVDNNIDIRQWRYCTIYSLLWPRGSVAKSYRLSLYNPYLQMPDTEREIVLDCLRGQLPVVNIKNQEWKLETENNLNREGATILRADIGDQRKLKLAIIKMMSEPIDTGTLLLYPRVKGVRRDEGCIDVVFELAEVLQ